MKGALFAGIFGGVTASVAGGMTLLFGGPVAVVAASVAALFGVFGAAMASLDAGTNCRGESSGLAWLTGLPAAAALSVGAYNLGTKLETPAVPAQSTATAEFNYNCTGSERPRVVTTDNGQTIIVPKTCTPIQRAR